MIETVTMLPSTCSFATFPRASQISSLLHSRVQESLVFQQPPRGIWLHALTIMQRQQNFWQQRITFHPDARS